MMKVQVTIAKETVKSNIRNLINNGFYSTTKPCVIILINYRVLTKIKIVNVY